MILGVLFGLVGYLIKGEMGAIILGIIGVLLGVMIMFFVEPFVWPIIERLIGLAETGADVAETGGNIIDALIFWD